jgi:uncharacterized protein (TIGR02996 family)
MADTDEQDLFAQLERFPGDEATRMVYADWLEQHGYEILARFVRGDDDTAVVSVSNLRWRANTSRARLVCDRPTCPGAWDRLVTTEHARVRRCTACHEFAVYCGSSQEASTAGSSRLVVAFDPHQREAMARVFERQRYPWRYGTYNPPPPGTRMPEYQDPYATAVAALGPDE